MANSWFRMYAEWADDPKVQMMPEEMQRRLAMLFCTRCKGVTLHETQLAFHWRISMEQLAETKALFIEQGFIDESWNVLNWNKRQFLSDSSTDRVRRHRQAKKQDETFPKQQAHVSVTAPDTDQIRSENALADVFVSSWNELSGALPKVQKLTKERRKKLRTRIGEGLTKLQFVAAVKVCASTAFLSGENDRRWKANFDWLIENEGNLLKVLEGKYGVAVQSEPRVDSEPAFDHKSNKVPVTSILSGGQVQ